MLFVCRLVELPTGEVWFLEESGGHHPGCDWREAQIRWPEMGSENPVTSHCCQTALLPHTSAQGTKLNLLLIQLPSGSLSGGDDKNSSPLLKAEWKPRNDKKAPRPLIDEKWESGNLRKVWKQYSSTLPIQQHRLTLKAPIFTFFLHREAILPHNGY